MSLTAPSKTAVDALFAAHHKAAKDAKRQMASAHKALAGKVLAENFDEASIREGASAVAALQADGIVAGATLLRNLRAALDPQEREQLNQTLEKHAAMIGMSEAGGPEGPRGPHGGRSRHHGL